MHVELIFLICAVLVSNINGDCEYSYVDCFSDFLKDFFGKPRFEKAERINKTNSFDNKTFGYEYGGTEDLDIHRVLSEIESVITEIDKDIRKSDLVTHEDNKTKILFKAFETDDNLDITDSTEKEPASKTTGTDLNDVSFSDLTATTPIVETTTETTFRVKPLHEKSEKDNEIFDDESPSYSEADERKFVTDYPDIDYIELYKDTTNEPVTYEVSYDTTEANLLDEFNGLRAEINKQEKEIENLLKFSLNLADDEALAEVVKNVSDHSILARNPDAAVIRELAPWIATIFLKNETGDQFDYYCDGALLSEKVVLTAARCVHKGNGSHPAENFIVILGKTSLQVTGGNERILRVQQVKHHENFTIKGAVATNDLALMILEEPVTLNDGISFASLRFKGEGQEDTENNIAVTTAWGLSGDIALIYFDKAKSTACQSNNKVENTFCATYGHEVALCPSYGGLYVTKQGDQLCLSGIRTGNPAERGICFNKNVNYTPLANYTQWISDNIET